MIKVHRETHQTIKENAVRNEMSIMEYLKLVAQYDRASNAKYQKPKKDL